MNYRSGNMKKMERLRVEEGKERQGTNEKVG